MATPLMWKKKINKTLIGHLRVLELLVVSASAPDRPVPTGQKGLQVVHIGCLLALGLFLLLLLLSLLILLLLLLVTRSGVLPLFLLVFVSLLAALLLLLRTEEGGWGLWWWGKGALKLSFG